MRYIIPIVSCIVMLIAALLLLNGVPIEGVG